MGQWVLLRSSDSNHTDQIYGRLWPARYNCQDDILVDRYITRSIPQEEHQGLEAGGGRELEQSAPTSKDTRYSTDIVSEK